MGRTGLKLLSLLTLFLAPAAVARAQTATYHLHREASTTSGLLQLKTAGPDAASLAIQSANLKGVAAGEYVVEDFDTQAGVPGAAGTIPAGSTITFSVWMRKSTTGGTVFPRAKLRLNGVSGTLLGTATGATALTSTLAKYTFSVSTASNISLTAADRFYVWVGVSVTAAPTTNTTAELDIEGAAGGNYDSTVVVPLPKRPNVTNVSPAAGPVGTNVNISGSNFGAAQGASTVTFNGVAAAPSSWGDTAIVAPVPAGATTGPVVVTVDGAASAGVTFNVGEIGGISGAVTRASDGTPVPGARVQALQSGVVKGSATSDNGGAYAINGLPVGVYDVQASAGGHEPQTQATQQVNAQAATEVNFGLQTALISYVYDESGRLVGVTDPSGDTATYAYDAVGNLTSITRNSSSQISVIEFTPDSGTAGTSVTVYGTGFSATPSQNTVKFNGVTAQVLSSTKTQIVTSVPAGATTGPISVTSPAGTASSASPFTVGAVSAPTVTGFTPVVGVAGDAVTVTGTNFHTTPSNNKLAFNGVRAVTNTATATSLTTNVPAGATSGRVSVTTPDGRGVSAADFFIPPSPYTGADVEVTGRIAFGESKSVTIGTADKVAMFLFDAPPGQRASLNITGVGLPGSTSVRLYRPDNSLQTSVNVSQGGTGYIDAQVLASAGTYAILIDPAAGSIGSLTLTLNDANDLTTTITPGGAAAAATVTTPGQRARLTFAAAAGQRVSVSLGSNSIPGTTTVYLVRPDGTNQTSAGVSLNGTQFIDVQTLATAGTYSLLVDPSGANTGGMSVQLHDVPSDSAGPITAGGASVTVTTTVPGHNRRLTFTGAFGQRVSLNFGANTIPGTTAVALIKPDGTNLTASTVALNATRYIDTLTLPMPGVYTVLVDPAGANTGSMSVQLHDATDVPATTITPGGGPVNVTTTVPGQNARVTFGGTEGQRVSLNITGVTAAGTNVTIQNPDGTTLATVSSGTAGSFIDAQTLPANGAYTILVDPSSTNTGGATLTLYDVPPDESQTITPGGPALTATTTAPGQNSRLSFDAAFGQRVTINFSANTIPGTTSVVLIKPDGTTHTSSSVTLNGTRFIDLQTLPSAGTYTILVDPATTNTGTTSVQLYDASEQDAGTITPGGPPVTVTTTQAGQSVRLTFGGTAGQRVSLSVSGVSISSSSLSIFNPDGSTLVNATTVGTGGLFVEPLTLPATGTYTITLNPSGTAVGSVTFRLFDVPADEAQAITPGGPAVTATVTAPGQNARLTFTGAFGQRVSLNFGANTIPGTSSVVLVRPDGLTLTSSTVALNATRFIDTQTLPMPGVYTILVDPATTNTGTMSVQLYDADDLSGVTITPGGEAVTVTTTQPGQSARLTFAGTAGQRVSMSVGAVAGSTATVTILNPDGTTVATASAGSGGAFIDAQTLAYTGTYTVLVNPSSTGTGSVTVTLYGVPADVTGSVQPGGAAFNVTTAAPGQNARLTFAGSFGQRVSLNFSANTIPGTTSLSLIKPDGTALVSTSVSQNSTRLVDTQTLPMAGVYTILVDPATTNTGGITVQLNDATDATGYSIAPGGPAVTVTVGVAGQSARATFGGTAGQRVSLRLTGVTIASSSVSIINPDGSPLSPGITVGTSGGFLDTQTLPVTGTYTVLVDPSTTNTGSATLQLIDVPADATGAVTIGGGATNVATTVSGQNARLSFGGAAGQRATVRVTNNTMSTTAVTMLNPDGTVLATATSSAANFNLTTQTLPVSDNYAVRIDPSGANTGGMSVAVTDDGVGTPGVLDVAASITPGGPPVTVTTTTSGQNARLTFAGTYGQRVSVNLSANTISGTTPVTLLRPDGSSQASVNVGLNGTGYIDAQTLPANGTYTILVDPSSTNTGGMTVKLNDAADVPATNITPGGAAVAVTTTIPGQNARATFGGTAGQRVSLRISGVTLAGTNVTIQNPDGTTLATVSSGTAGSFIDAQTLPANGAYTILVDPSSTNTGGATLTLYDVPPDDAGTITPGGAAVAVTAGVPGQNQRLTFSGTPGQRVSINASGNSIPGSTRVYLYKPDGTSITNVSVSQNGTGYIDVQTLPSAGTYFLLVDPATTNTGAMTVQLNDASEQDAGTITPGGPPVTVTTTQPGQSARLTFGGTAGQRVSLNVSGVTLTGGNVTILNPDGSALVGSTSFSSGGVFVEPRTLPVAGSYTILVDPSSTNVGGATLTLYDVPSDDAGAITPGGAAVSVTAGVPGQNQRLTFNGTFGQRVSLNLSGNTIPGSTNVALQRPDGTNIASVNVSLNGTNYIDALALPADGTYVILVNPQTVNTGAMNVQLNDAAEAAGNITPGGQPVTVNVTASGQNARLTFAGSTGQRVSLNVTGVTIPGTSNVAIVNPNGTTLASASFGTGGTFIDAQTLPTNGTYTIVVDPSSTNTGGATLTLYDVPSDDAGTITPGSAVVSVTAGVPGQNQRLSFAGAFGQRVSVSLSADTIPGSTNVQLRRPDGTSVGSLNVSQNGTGYIDALSLPMPGNYTIFVNPSGVNTGGMSVRLNDATELDAGAITPGGAAAAVSITQPGQTARLTFAGTEGQQVAAQITNNTMSTVTVTVLNPDGTVLTSMSSSAAAFNLATQTLPASGAFIIRIDPSGSNTGDLSVTLAVP